MSKGNLGAFIGGILLGSAVGTVAGILIAPRKGKETRQIIKKSARALPELAEDLSTTIQLQADRLSDSALQNWEGTLERLKEAISAGIEATQLETEQLGSSSNTNQSLTSESSSHVSKQNF
ncbi:MAG: YtxH domain-containing protein [Okeania sp. SIO2D1]|nr:YtxH domain-containing protein [Okeania sp. SIO2D1]